jgi:predicted ATP-grasp superfamily ATP-dependent carboligase
MRVFVYEHTCAETAGTAPSLDTLRNEGRAMLGAVVADFAALDSIDVVTIDSADEAAFRREAARAAWSLIVAPEFDDILATRCLWVESSGGRLLGPSSPAVRLAADKLALADHWHRREVPTPPCQLLLPGKTPPSIFWPAVCKPRFGAGSQATFLVRSPAELSDAVHQARAEGYHGELLLHPYVPGWAASVTWLIGPRQQLPLAPAEQALSSDGRFHYLGGVLPLPAPLAQRAITLSRRAIECVPGLLGYIGVDLVLGADDGQDRVIELNPRLTTSYLGLRALARANLAELMLRVARGELVAEPPWHGGTVRFTADGSIARFDGASR